MKKVIFTLIALFCILSSEGQIFRDSDLYYDAGITSVKGKYFNGSGGKGCWTFDKVDSIGRTTERRSFRKAKLLQRTSYTYNSNNDATLIVYDNDPNNPYRIDSS